MLKAALLTLTLAVALPLAAQPDPAKPPAAAKAHLMQRYPKATVKEWKQGAKLFRAVFMLKGEKHTAVYTAEGVWVRTEHDIRKEEVPTAVMGALRASKYSAWKLDDQEAHATPEHASVFKLTVASETQKAEMHYLPNGKLMKEEVKAKKVKEAKK